MEVKSRRLNEKEGSPVAFDTAKESGSGEASQDWVPVPLSGAGMAFQSLRLCRLIFIEVLCSNAEQWLGVGGGSVASDWLKRAAERAVAGQPPRKVGWGKSPGGRVEGRGTTREIVAGGAPRQSATGGQAAKKVGIGDQPFK